MERLGNSKTSKIVLLVLACILVAAAMVFICFGVFGRQASQGAADSSLRLYFCSEVTARSAEQKAALAGTDPSETAANNDCILLEYDDALGEPHRALVDTGYRWENDDGGTVAIEWLKSHGVKRLDWMLITHQHGDHMGEAAAILDGFDVGALYMKHFDGNWVLKGVTEEETAREMLGVDESVELPKKDKYYLDFDGIPLRAKSGSKSYAKIVRAAIENGTRVIGPSWAEVNPEDPICASASPGLCSLEQWVEWLESKAPSNTPTLFEPFDDSNVEFDFGPASIRIVNWREYDVNGEVWNEASPVEHEAVIGENHNSLGVVIQVGDARAFLAGDIVYRSTWNGMPAFSGELNDEQRIADEVGDVDFYKAAHHGYNSSSSNALLDVIRPEAVMITNTVGKASPKVIKRLERHGCVCIMYTTEDPVETIVELTPNAVRMKRASEDDWAYEAPAKPA